MAVYLQYLAVALIVLWAAAYVAAKYLPAAWRRRLALLLARRGAMQSRLARWLDADAACGSGCGSCGSCASGQQAQPGQRPVTFVPDARPRRLGQGRERRD